MQLGPRSTLGDVLADWRMEDINSGKEARWFASLTDQIEAALAGKMRPVTWAAHKAAKGQSDAVRGRLHPGGRWRGLRCVHRANLPSAGPGPGEDAADRTDLLQERGARAAPRNPSASLVKEMGTER